MIGCDQLFTFVDVYLESILLVQLTSTVADPPQWQVVCQLPTLSIHRSVRCPSMVISQKLSKMNEPIVTMKQR